MYGFPIVDICEYYEDRIFALYIILYKTSILWCFIIWLVNLTCPTELGANATAVLTHMANKI